MKKEKKFGAVILGADVNGLGHVRSLGMRGIYSFLICANRGGNNLACFSKYCVSCYIPKNIKLDECELIDVLVELANNRTKKLVLYPTSDYFVNFIVSNFDKLKEHYLYNIIDIDMLRLITNKENIEALAQKAGIKSPKTFRGLDFNSFIDMGKFINFPSIIKPINSYDFSFPGKNRIVENIEQFEDFALEFKDLRKHIIVQEIIPGGEKNIFQCTGYMGSRTPPQFFTMKKIRQFPPGYGTTSLGVSVENKDLIEYTKRLLKNLNYKGFASVEYKQSDLDHQYYLIEINPRLPWYNSLFYACGVNFPYLAYLDLTQSPSVLRHAMQQKNNICWMHFKNQLSGFGRRWMSESNFQSIIYLKEIFNARCFGCYDGKDPKPFLKAMIELFRWAYQKIIKKPKIELRNDQINRRK